MHYQEFDGSPRRENLLSNSLRLSAAAIAFEIT